MKLGGSFFELYNKVQFTTDNTIERRLATKHETDQRKYDKNGIYQLICPDLKMKYTGQTGRPFKIRFQEHFRLQIREQQVEIRPTPPRKRTFIRPNGRCNGHRPHSQQRQNYGHIKKIHLQRDKIQQLNQ